MTPMTGAELRVIIEQLGMGQDGVAEILGAHHRTIHKWIAKDRVPQAEAILLRILHSHKGPRARGNLLTIGYGGPSETREADQDLPRAARVERRGAV